MTRSVRYYMLVTALPALPPLFRATQPPISRLRLDERLGLLTPWDAQQLAWVEDLLHWERLAMDCSDETVVRQAQETFSQLADPRLEAIVRDRLELRTLVAALRRRESGDTAPDRGVQWGVGRWTDHIRRHWNDPHFRLEVIFPWLPRARELLKTGASLELERHLLGVVWKQLSRAREGHYFDLLVVVVYVLKWNLIARWCSYDGEAAAKRLDELVTGGLGEHASLFTNPNITST